ncbi:unnamed protein product [Brugia timori]|uniref:Magnesium transporter n=1 Tax=Brugia timori TaxID=42155 RepID=A0A0R3QIB1_9BILA|nr:unnamed protein product [Brugia timori]
MSNTEDGKDEEIEQLENKIDWESLLNVANDPDFNELLQSPIDDAINILKTGREIQKLSIIRTLNDLLETDGDQVVEKVMPAIQVGFNVHCVLKINNFYPFKFVLSYINYHLFKATSDIENSKVLSFMQYHQIYAFDNISYFKFKI